MWIYLHFRTCERVTRHETAWRIEEARVVRHFSNVHDLALRADLASDHLKLLASAGALESFSGNRRQALWLHLAVRQIKGLLCAAEIEEDELTLAPLQKRKIWSRITGTWA